MFFLLLTFSSFPALRVAVVFATGMGGRGEEKGGGGSGLVQWS